MDPTLWRLRAERERERAVYVSSPNPSMSHRGLLSKTNLSLFIQVKALVGVQGVAMSTTAVTLFRSFVQKPIFSVSPSSFSLSQI